ncbi:hypothetical protein BKA61DRAFT_732648 [Leptodontidium sp. MPI-SDFR-AT-0119]|nr:hypothetical protein BKA61DRAFT_732648 [Leptodontidium sp. MPI-SDFR-AT-0119]
MDQNQDQHTTTSTTMSPTGLSIRPFTPSISTSNSDFETVYNLWNATFPTWPIPRTHLWNILYHPLLARQGRHFVAEIRSGAGTESGDRNEKGQERKPIGFVLAYLGDESTKGYISALGVREEARGRGVGGELLERAVVELKRAASEKGCELKSLVLGSDTPRFWPGLPTDFGEGIGVGGWFGRRGFKKLNGPVIRDLFKDIREEVVPSAVKERIEKVAMENGIRFAPWTEGGYEECMVKQQENFSWAKAYAVLAAHSQYHEVMVAFDAKTNEQLGWTLMCGPDAIVKDIYAFLPLAGKETLGEKGKEVEGEKGNVGLIAAVGVDKKARGRGVGLALVGRAMENLKERGVEGIFIDSVVIRDFYERLGFETRWEYEAWEWVGGLGKDGAVNT